MKLFKQYDFTRKVNNKELGCFLFPFFLSAGFQCVYALVNTAVVSRYLSQEAVAVINACSGCVSIVNSMLPAFISGFGIYLTRCIGSGDSGDSRQGFWGTVYISLAFGILCLILLPFSEVFLRYSNISQQLLPDATVYFNLILSGAFLLYLKLILISTIQAMGNSTIPSLAAMAGVVTQTLLVVFLIAIMHMGIAAPALALLLNNLWQVFVLVYFLHRFSKGRLGLASPFRINRACYRMILINGFSKGILFIFLAISTFIMQRMENCLSTDLLAGDAYCDQFTILFTNLLCAYGTAAVVIVGQNAGKGNYRLLDDYIRRFNRHSLVWCILIGIISLAFAPLLISGLAGNGGTPEAIEAGIFEMRIIVVSYPFLTALVTLRYALQTMGDYLAMPVFGFVEMSLTIAMAMLIPKVGYVAVCLGLSLSRIGAGLAAILRYRRFMKKKLCD